MQQSGTQDGNVVPLRQADPSRAPYFLWLDREFPGGDMSWNPPVRQFFDSRSLRNAWVSHPVPGSDLGDLRIDLYLRRRWRTDEEALCVGNCGAAGEKAPRGWTADTLASFSASLAEVERLAKDAGFLRVAVEFPSDDVRMACLDAGYRVATANADEQDLVKDLT